MAVEPGGTHGSRKPVTGRFGGGLGMMGASTLVQLASRSSSASADDRRLTPRCHLTPGSHFTPRCQTPPRWSSCATCPMSLQLLTVDRCCWDALCDVGPPGAQVAAHWHSTTGWLMACSSARSCPGPAPILHPAPTRPQRDASAGTARECSLGQRCSPDAGVQDDGDAVLIHRAAAGPAPFVIGAPCGAARLPLREGPKHPQGLHLSIWTPRGTYRRRLVLTSQQQQGQGGNQPAPGDIRRSPQRRWPTCRRAQCDGLMHPAHQILARSVAPAHAPSPVSTAWHVLIKPARGLPTRLDLNLRMLRP